MRTKHLDEINMGPHDCRLWASQALQKVEVRQGFLHMALDHTEVAAACIPVTIQYSIQ